MFMQGDECPRWPYISHAGRVPDRGQESSRVSAQMLVGFMYGHPSPHWFDICRAPLPRTGLLNAQWAQVSTIGWPPTTSVLDYLKFLIIPQKVLSAIIYPFMIWSLPMEKAI